MVFFFHIVFNELLKIIIFSLISSFFSLLKVFFRGMCVVARPTTKFFPESIGLVVVKIIISFEEWVYKFSG